MTGVWIVGQGSKNNDIELKYSIRAALKYCAEITNIMIVGHCPDWIKPDHYIPMADPFVSNPDGNITSKIIQACKSIHTSERFVVFHDDIFLLTKTSYKNWTPTYKGQLKPEKLTNFYEAARNRTHLHLQKFKLPTRNYDVHRPYVVDKTLFAMTMSRFPWDRVFMVHQSLYFNALESKAAKQEDNKIFEWKAPTKGDTFFSVADTAVNSNFVKWMEKRFPKPSKYELHNNTQ